MRMLKINTRIMFLHFNGKACWHLATWPILVNYDYNQLLSWNQNVKIILVGDPGSWLLNPSLYHAAYLCGCHDDCQTISTITSVSTQAIPETMLAIDCWFSTGFIRFPQRESTLWFAIEVCTANHVSINVPTEHCNNSVTFCLRGFLVGQIAGKKIGIILTKTNHTRIE